MGKKTTKKRTIWKSLPLTTEEAGDCSEDDVSTTSSGRSPGLVLRMRSNGYRHRHLSDREPLVKLESKTFDEEEYTKITTPRQDVLFKKGYFARKKLESSIEEGVYPVNEEEEQMEQMIITNGFVDERGHYLMNGNSYEIYDPYTNTVTVVVGPPPYTNGITPPVLAAMSCQPVPLQPVDWYPPGGGEWPPGPAWTPAYPKPENGEESPGSEEAAPALYPPQPFLFQNLIYPLPIDIAIDEHAGVGHHTEEDACHRTEQENAPNDNEEVQNVAKSTPLKPTVEEFIPSSHVKPVPAFDPTSRVLKPAPQPQQNGTDASALRPNGAVFVPRGHQRQQQQHTIQHPKPQPQERTISMPPQETPQPPEPLRTEAPSDPPQLQLPEEKIVAESARNSPRVNETENAKETAAQESVGVVPSPAQETESKELIKVAVSINGNCATSGSGVAEDTPKKESHGTQTPKEPEQLSPQPSPRRSYAKTVSNGASNNDPLMNGSAAAEPNNQPLDTRDNKLVDVKKIVQNGTSLTNGYDERLTNVRENSKNTKNIKDNKRTNMNGYEGKRDVENGYYRHNGASPHRYPKDRYNGNDKIIRKDTKEVFYNKKPDSNGVNNGKSKETLQNGHYNGKEKSYNKEKQSSKSPIISDKKLDVRTDARIILSDDSDKSETFRPVETRRNRAQLNGNAKSKQQPLRVDIFDKEPMDPRIEDSIINESKPVLERLNTTISVKTTESEKSSTLSELSSPTDLSSGQTTPPDNAALVQLQENHAADLSKSADKLREGLIEKKKKSSKKKKNAVTARIAPKETKAEEVLEEPPPLPEFLQIPKDDIMDLDLTAALDHALLRSLRQSEPAISKINLFPPRAPSFPLDLYTKTNLSQMRATKPEEFFASIVDTPGPGDFLRQTEKTRRTEKLPKPQMDLRATVRKPINTAYKPSRKPVKDEADKSEKEDKDEPKLGIVDAVKSWLETQDGVALPSPEEPIPESDESPKNAKSNPSRASSVEGEDGACLRVAASPDLAALTDAKASVDKYYNLTCEESVASCDSREQSMSPVGSREQEAVDALEYAFPRPPAIAAQFPKDLACKLQ